MQNIVIKRKKIDEEEEEEKEAPFPTTPNQLSNKERAKMHRQRKKQFYLQLETDNKQLKQDLINLKELNKRLEDRLAVFINNSSVKDSAKGEESEALSEVGEEVKFIKKYESANLIKLKRTEYFHYYILPRLCMENPEKIKLSLVEQNREEIGAYGDARVSFLKEQFNNIIENIVPTEMKFALMLGDFIPVSKFVRMARSKCNKFQPNKLANSAFGRGILKITWSDRCLEFFKVSGTKYVNLMREVRENIQELVKLRNKTLNTLQDFIKCNVKENFYTNYPYSKFDIASFAENMLKLQKENVFNKFDLFKIRKREKSTDYKNE
mmetsp:Transcript_19318/g.17136  ORF Transcript_19318/g.17136 Transcript_19318/m.17136 type:complete len:323 (-) Transcript_19318:45-1013(-)